MLIRGPRAILALLLAGTLSPALAAQSPALQISPRNYDLSIEVNYDQETLHGSARVRVENTSSRPATQIPLLLYRLMRVTSVQDESGRRLPVAQRVESFADFPQLQVNSILVTLPHPLLPRGQTVLRIEWEGFLLGYSETGMHYVQDHIAPAFTILRLDAFVYPVPGVLSIAVNRQAPQPRFDYRARITVPDSLRVVNGGHLDSVRRQGGRATFEFTNLKPAWRMDFAIAQYGELVSGPVRVYYLPGDSAGAAGVGQAAGAALDLFRSWFGELRGRNELAFIEIPDGWGSQTDVTAIIQTAAAFRDPKRYREVYHEISHLWNVPATDRPSPRLEEGLASFLEDLAAEKLAGTPVIDAHANRVLDWLRKELPQHPEWGQTPPMGYGRVRLTDLSYSVGALWYDLLYHQAGPEAFNRVIAEYYAGFQASGGSTEDLLQVIRRVVGTRADGLIEDWVRSPRWTERIRERQDIADLRRLY